VRTVAATIGTLALAAGAYFAVTTAVKDPDDRPASVSCWWYPGVRAADVGWRFGERPPGVERVDSVTKNGPFLRKSRVRVGDVVSVTVTWPDHDPREKGGLAVECTVRAGFTRQTFRQPDHTGLSKSLVTT
jgi:hypothetical protein